MEAALSQLQDAPESIPLTQQHLMGLTAEALDAMVLQPRHASRLWAFAYPVEAWYTAVQEGKAPAPPQPHASYLLVYRHDDVVWRMNLEADEFALLQQLLAGTPVNAAMATLQQKVVGDDTTLEASLAQWFSRWMRNGVFRHSPESVLQWQAS